VDDDGESAERGAPLYVRQQVRRDVDALFRRPEDEVAGVEDELLALVDDRLVDVLVDLPLRVGVDAGDVRPLELQELPPESEVDARRLNLQVEVLQWFDDEVALLEPAEDVRVREDHTE